MITETRYVEDPRNWIVLDGKSLKDFKVYCSGDKTFSSPQRIIESISIPGRNGVLHRDKGAFDNIDVQYSCWIPSDFRNNIEALRNYLGSLVGYKRIEDTYNPDNYRLGMFQGPLDVSGYYASTFGSFTLAFNCRPERYLKSGEKVQTFTAGSHTIYNPSMFPSKPLIRAYGTGSITTGGRTVTVKAANSYTDIDMEQLNAYKGDTNCNVNVTATDKSKWLLLEPGRTNITVTGFTKIEITPRWWIL